MKKVLLIILLMLGITSIMQSQSDSSLKRIDLLIRELYPETEVVINDNTITCEILMKVWSDKKDVNIKDLREIVKHEHKINILAENFTSELRKAAFKQKILGYLCERDYIKVIFKDNHLNNFKRYRSNSHSIL